MNTELLARKLRELAKWFENRETSKRSAYPLQDQAAPRQIHTASRSPDSPVKSRDEDLLGRWRFAKNIYELVQTAPKDWSLRVGVFGDWGSGKTSVLKFIETMASKDSNVVAWFNPWEAMDRESLWADFATSIYAAVENAGIDIPNTLKHRIRIIARKAGDPAKAIAKIDSKAEALTGLISSPLKRWLVAGAGELSQIPSRLGEKRLIVMVDDLDRASPEIVPHLLLAIRELLDLPNFVFILAFDPDVVVAALGKDHPGWENGFQFLDKIIDFQYRLPKTTNQQNWLLASTEIESTCDFVDLEALKLVFDLVPSNPRKLKQYIRQLWSLKPELARHNQNELNWANILLCQLLKLEYPSLFEAIFGSGTLLKQIATFYIRLPSPVTSRQDLKREDSGFAENLESLFESLGITLDKDKERATEIILAIGTRALNILAPGIEYQALIAEQPHALTWREFGSFYDAWKKEPTASEGKNWLRAHAQNREEDCVKLYKETFKTAVGYRLQLLEEASDVHQLEDLLPKAEEARKVLELLKQLCFDMDGFTGTKPLLGPDDFSELLAMVEHWLHFTNLEVYKRLRLEERTFLLECVEKAPQLASPIFELLKPWDPFRGGVFHEDLRSELRCELAVVAQEYILNDLISRFEQPGGIRDLWGSEQRFAEKYVLLRSESPIWEGVRWDQVRAIAGRAGDEAAIHDNFIEFVRLLVHGCKEGLNIVSRDEVRQLGNNKEIVQIAWKAATARRIQPRLLGSFKDFREYLKNIAGTEDHLVLPDWWE